ncbi:hypothetical protein ACFRAE_10600 [Sphingobacterium sp. HJSM2_6]|uniref:hypothetical protein n=1 Tax=Sphingobacterium sp. HJSM2_6 TaxID=3366264 RepID=UPI003BECBD55
MYCKAKDILILCFFVLISISTGYAQEKDNVISGLVLEKGSSERVSEANIANLRSKAKVVSNSYGVFTIEVQIGDTLSISKVGYGPVKTVINTLEDILVDMQAGTTLETIVITRSTKEAELNQYLKDYEKKGIYNGGHNRLGTYVSSPATALYNLFGKEAKNAKRFERYVSQELEATKVDRIFNKTLVSRLTSLEGDDLQSFMELYRPSLTSVEKWGEYDLMTYITNSFKSWNAQGRPQPQRLPKLTIPTQEK